MQFLTIRKEIHFLLVRCLESLIGQMFSEINKKRKRERSNFKMNIPLATYKYMGQFQESMPYDQRENEELNEYSMQQFEQLNQLINIISSDNFWGNIPRILGIDT